jgi:segregation and condensation protein A
VARPDEDGAEPGDNPGSTTAPEAEGAAEATRTRVRRRRARGEAPGVGDPVASDPVASDPAGADRLDDGAPRPDAPAPGAGEGATAAPRSSGEVPPPEASDDGSSDEGASSEDGADAASPRPKRRKKLTPEEEVRAWLGDDLRTPTIPKDYRPIEASRHQLFRVELTAFAGPLDLLLHLIREHELDIFDIPISFVVEKYLEFLDKMSDLPIDVAAEFLVMAAELTHIKSKMLLPPKEGVPVEAPEELADPRADLVHRLLEYQKYREAAENLERAGVLGRDVFARQPPPDPELTEVETGLGDLSIFRLVESMADVLSRLTPEKQHEVVADTVTITERMQFILDFGEARGLRFPFLDLFAGMESRRVVVMTFLAILEMARTRMLRIEQTPQGEPGPGEPLPAEAPAASTEVEPAAEGAASTEVAAPTTADGGSAPALEARHDPAGEALDAAYEAAMLEREEPVRRFKLASELPPLVVPAPREIVLVLTGKKLEDVPDAGSGLEAGAPPSRDAP